jgi:hypothetical protein
MQLDPAARLAPQLFFAILKSPLIVTLVMVSVEVPVFFTVTVLVGLLAPTLITPKARLTVERVTRVPVPVRLIFCGFPLALSVNVSIPLRVPIAVGWNATLTVQLDPEARRAPQVFAVIAKSPLPTTLVKVTATAPVFLSVTVILALVMPTSSLGNVRLAGANVTVPGGSGTARSHALRP